MTTRTALTAAVMAAAMAYGAPTGTVDAQTIELKVSHFLPPGHKFHLAMTAWGEQLARGSGGRLRLQIFPAGQLGPVNRQFDLARTGVADIAISLHNATPGRYPLTELATLPLTAPSAGVTSEIMSRRLTELAPDYLAAEHEGLKILWMAVTPPLMFHTARQPIRKVADFRGLRIRYAGTTFQKIIEAVGAVPLAVPPAETTDALSKGIIDGATFPYEATKAFDLGTAAKFSLEPGVSSATFAVVMNPAKFDALPDDLQKLVTRTTGPDAAEHFGRSWDEGETEGKAYMVERGVEIITLPAPELAKLKAGFAAIVEEAVAALEAEGKPARAMLDAYTR